MPRKKILTRRVRRLTPTELEYILNGVVAYDAHLQADWDYFEIEGLTKKAQKASQSLQGLYENLAIIVEDIEDEEE